jgi:recombination protein RecR
MSNELEDLINLFSKLPGLGPRSARRAILHMLKYKDTLMPNIARTVEAAHRTIKLCTICGNVDIRSPCSICLDDKRDNLSICVVETIADLWALEKGHVFKGHYHVLGGTLSAVEQRGPDTLNIENLVRRVAENNIREVILATNATIDGQTTAFYISERLEPLKTKVTRLAYGLPVGGELDYLDEGTLSAALASRKALA